MSLHRLGFKVRAGFDGKLEEFIPVFHGWIQRKAVDGLLVDVADYSHLPNSPGVVLVGFEADRSMDVMEGPLGLLYMRKQPGAGLKDALRAALDSCVKLEDEPALNGRLRFTPSEILFIANDRLAAPNDGATWAKIEPELKALLPGAAITRDTTDPRRRLTARIQGLTGDVRSVLASL
jgi:hypothetical protein